MTRSIPRSITRRRACPWAFALLFVLALGAAPAAAQFECDETPDCTLFGTCTTGANACEVGQTETFTLFCTYEVPDTESCELPEIGYPIGRCCEPFFDIPHPVWYNGERLVNGYWVTEVECVYAANPLSYTFIAQDVGTVRRQACTDSSCSVCSDWETFEIVYP